MLILYIIIIQQNLYIFKSKIKKLTTKNLKVLVKTSYNICVAKYLFFLIRLKSKSYTLKHKSDIHFIYTEIIYLFYAVVNKKSDFHSTQKRVEFCRNNKYLRLFSIIISNLSTSFTILKFYL